MRDRLWRIRQTPQKFHYLDWCEKIKEKYSSREEYGFAGATLTFLQGEKESEQKKSGEERRLMLFFQNLIFCWQNSIGVKISIGNARILEESPDDAERSPDKAAAAHPHARRHPAEDRLHDISEERADYQKQRDLVKTKAVGEYRLSLLSLRLELLPVYRLRVGVLDTAVHPAIDLPLKP